MDYRYIRWEVLLEKTYAGLFCSFDGHAIEFCFLIDNSDIKKKLHELILKGGGQIVDEYVNRTPKTVLMVDDKCVRNFYNCVSFKTSYIINCINEKVLQDINNYIHNNVNWLKKIDFMDIVYYKKFTFDEYVKINKVHCTKHHFETHNNDRQDLLFEKRKQKKIANIKCLTKQCLNPCEHCSLNSASEVEHPEREEIEEMQVVKHCRTCNCNEVEKESSLNKKKNRELEVVSIHNLDISDIEVMPTTSRHHITPQSSPIRHESTLKNNSPDKHKEIQKNKINITSIESSDDDDVGFPVPQTSNREIDKHTRRLYSRREKEAILKYIIQKKAIHLLGGVNFWKQMERSKICPSRTWMSLSNHFRKTIRLELETFPFLTSDQIAALKN